MALNYPKLALEDVEETRAFRVIDTILGDDPTLRRVVKNYNAWRGEADDLQPPCPATCPNLQLGIRADGSRWEAEGLHHLPFTVTITCAVAGTNLDQLANLWGHVRRALWPRDPARMAAVRKLVQDAGISRPTLTMGGYGVQVLKDGGRILIAQGSLNLLLLVSTP